MKNVLSGLLVFAASSAIAAAPVSSAIVLPGGGKVAPAGSVTISLAPLLKEVNYNLTCELTNPQAEAVDMRFEPSQAEMYGQVSLNELVLDNLQGSLQAGNNTITVNEVRVGNGNAVLQFKNLDFGHAVEVSHCVAKPAIKTRLMSSAGGAFVAYNDTCDTVELRVGNFFPTPYILYPHSSRWVFVSTDNQNITISNIY